MEKKYHTFYKIIGILRDSFYKTRDPAPLMQELSNAGIEFPSDMITVEELEGGNMGGVEPVKEGKSEETIFCLTSAYVRRRGFTIDK